MTARSVAAELARIGDMLERLVDLEERRVAIEEAREARRGGRPRAPRAPVDDEAREQARRDARRLGLVVHDQRRRR
jgi:hypothetical protein